MKMIWHEFPGNKLPPGRRDVLVQLAAEENLGLPPAVVVGYLRDAAGCKDSPQFITPGVGGRLRIITHWCDCLGDEFNAPLWKNTNNTRIFKK